MRHGIVGGITAVLSCALFLAACGGAGLFGDTSAEVAVLRAGLDQAQADIAALESKCLALEATLAALTAQATTNGTQIATLDTAATTRQQQLDALATTVAGIQTSLDNHLNNLPSSVLGRPGLGLRHEMTMQGIFPSRNLTAPDASAELDGDPVLASVQIWAGTFTPRGYAACDGSLLPINTWQAVFSLVGTIYGGDGRTTFAVPDLRGRAAVGDGTGTGLDPVRLGERLP